MGNDEALFAHCATDLTWMARRHPFPNVKLVDHDLSINLSEANRVEDHMVLVATEPLTHGEPWTRFARNELKVLVDGALVWSSKAGGANSSTGHTSDGRIEAIAA
jgi:glutamine amidotransferase